MYLPITTEGCAGCCEMAGQVGVPAVVEPPASHPVVVCTAVAVGILILVPGWKVKMFCLISSIIIFQNIITNHSKENKLIKYSQ